MELSAYAERILYGTTLEEKLLAPEHVTDLSPRRIERIPDTPGRPLALRLDGDGPKRKVAFPGVHELTQGRSRGHVLHFFANHELLALELMALMLLRFPDAPPSFRMGIFRTMREEQNHLAMYRERMEAAGVEFGEIPVNGFFWKTLRDVQSPLEFVAGMSMTFEQANLDFAGYYARAFRRVGDIETADVLDIVYEEEIGHVKHGVTWFDRWRPKERSRFRAFEVLLPEGLSPIRAKGTDFDVEARRLAGLDDAFIESLRLYRASRGRPPHVYLFNPGVEEEARFGAAWQAPRALEAMTADLSPLVGFLAAEEDIVLCPRPPSDAHRAYLDSIGFVVPDYRTLGPTTPLTTVIDERHVGEFLPWGISPVTVERFAPLVPSLLASRHDAVAKWGHGTRIWAKHELHSLRTGVVAQLRDDTPALADVLIPADAMGDVATTIDEVLAWLDATAHRPVVIKASRGASGRGAIRVLEPALTDTQQAWVERMLRYDGAVVLEQWRERVADLSWQMHVGADETIHHGATRFLTDRRGQFLGAVLHRMTEGLEQDLVRWIHADGRASRWLRTVQQRVGEAVAAGLRARGYEGPVGIDAMIYREDGRYVLQPIVEINTRTTMGGVALQLERRVARRRVGVMLIQPIAGLKERHGSVAAAAAWSAATHPPLVLGVGQDRGVDGGIVWLTDPSQATSHVALLIVGRDWSELEAQADALSASVLVEGGGLLPPVERDA